MKHLTNWIRTHQLAAFYIITFAISWGLWFAPGPAIRGESLLLAPLAFAAACSPALSGIIITALSNIGPHEGKRSSFWIVLPLAWILSLIITLLHSVFINHLPLSIPLIVYFAVSVLPVAFVITSIFSRNPAVRRYLSSLVQLRGVWGWAVLAMVFIPVMILLSVPASNLLEGRPLADYPFPEVSFSLLGLIAVKFLYQLFFFNATGEEVGWRGFALPRLQARISPLLAALTIGLLWAPWHFFFWQAEGKPVMTWGFWADMFAGHFLFSILIVWICNRANGSILVAGITHAAANTAFAFVSLHTIYAWLVPALALILVDRMWKKLPSDHPAVYRPTEQAPNKPAAINQHLGMKIGA